MVCVVGKIRDLILQLSKSSIYSTKPRRRYSPASNTRCWRPSARKDLANIIASATMSVALNTLPFACHTPLISPI
ncbi:hypothetical protein FMJ19_29495 [Klebsiella michiganensis]|nr:hypothetical protein [Klebsiella michiganensis]TNJ90497.1 hypothetical protein CI664_028515 [Klebsiella quasipneumoniae subsp. similipneumoniae]